MKLSFRGYFCAKKNIYLLKIIIHHIILYKLNSKLLYYGYSIIIFNNFNLFTFLTKIILKSKQ